MFARQVFRPANVLRQQARRFASTEPQNSEKSNGLLYTCIVLGCVGGAYGYLRRKNPKPIPEHLKKYEPVKHAFTGGDQGFLSLLLEEVEVVNHNVKKMRFKLPEENMTSGLPVASAVITKYKGPNMEKPVIRPYTPTSDTDEKGFVDFVIKQYPEGAMSQHLHNMEPGQRLDIKGPIPKYPWVPNKHEHVVMIAGGTGITPMWQVANAIFKNPEDKTKVTLVFGNVKEEDILLKREWEHLENTYPQRFRAFYVLNSPPESWQGGKGFVTKELLKTVMPEPKEGDNVKVFVCGPPGLYKAISGTKKSPSDQGELDGYLKELGYNKDQVYKF